MLGLILDRDACGTVYLHLLGRIHYVGFRHRPDPFPGGAGRPSRHPAGGDQHTAPNGPPEDVTSLLDYDADIGRDSDIINILLIGQDRREETRARSDSMIPCTFHKSEKKLTMTSFLRDTYVKIPGYGQNRINVAYAAGGMPF